MDLATLTELQPQALPPPLTELMDVLSSERCEHLRLPRIKALHVDLAKYPYGEIKDMASQRDLKSFNARLHIALAANRSSLEVPTSCISF